MHANTEFQKQEYLTLRKWINEDRLDWCYLNGNTNAIHLLQTNPSKIRWGVLSKNQTAGDLLIANGYCLRWKPPAKNNDLFSKGNILRLDWPWLSSDPNAIHLLEANQDKINWGNLSCNPSAIHLLEANQDKIDWKWLSENPSIFTYNYKRIKQEREWLAHSLIEYFYHPRFVEKWLSNGNELEDYLV